jgi:hypothetical protein
MGEEQRCCMALQEPQKNKRKINRTKDLWKLSLRGMKPGPRAQTKMRSSMEAMHIHGSSSGISSVQRRPRTRQHSTQKKQLPISLYLTLSLISSHGTSLSGSGRGQAKGPEVVVVCIGRASHTEVLSLSLMKS